MEMNFYKYRVQWSGARGEWKFIRLPEGETARSFFGEMESKHQWSEHFRGIQYKKVDMPPSIWLQSEMGRMSHEVNELTRLVIAYAELLRTKPTK